jgi:hypothetical protein
MSDFEAIIAANYPDGEVTDTVFHYGDTYEDGYRVDRNTIHDTGTIDIQVDENGEVVAVWFRCLQLPFKVSETPVPGKDYSAYGKVEITGIDWRNA